MTTTASPTVTGRPSSWSGPSALLFATGLVTALLLAPAVSGASEAPPADRRVIHLSQAERDRIGLTTATVAAPEGRQRVPVVGEVTAAPNAVHHVRTPVDARIEQLPVAPGDRVVRGQILATLHSHEVHRAVAELRLAQQRVQMARNQEANGKALFDVEGISRVELERRQLAVFEAEMAEQNAVLELEDLGFRPNEIDTLTQEMMHGELPVRAALSGVVLELPVAASDRVERHTELMVIGDPDRLELSLQMSPEAAGSVSPGDLVRFAPVGQSLCCSARLQSQVPTVDPQTRTVRLRARIEADGGTPHSPLVPGTFVEGVLTAAADGPNSISSTQVPTDSIVRFGNDDVVFVELGAREFEIRKVTVGARRDAGTQILRGLRIGESVVERGAFLLKSLAAAGEASENDGGGQP